jgi:diguanylate cyclase
MSLHAKFHATRYSALLLVAWLLMSLLGICMMINIEIMSEERLFEHETDEISVEIQQKLLANDAVLSGFSAFLQAVEKSDQPAVARYAREALIPYPHIYMLEVALQVPVSEQQTFQEGIRKSGQNDFSIKNFAELTGQSQTTDSLSTNIWPIVFMFPTYPAAREIYGVRLETVAHLSETLRLAAQANRAFASPIFQLKEGENAYILLRNVRRSSIENSASSPNFFGSGMVALLLTKSQSLLPNRLKNSSIGMVAELLSEASSGPSVLFMENSPTTHWLDRKTLPLFSKKFESGIPSQPVRLSYERQLRWADILSSGLLAIVSLLAISALVVGYLVKRHHFLTGLATAEHERASYLATHDTLTKLPNRQLLADRFDQALHRWQRHGAEFALFLIDIDHFKEINDHFGHEAGDAVLVATAERIAGLLRASDTVARYGGDEFVVLVADILNSADALALGKKLCDQLSQPLVWHNTSLVPSCSLGIAVCPNNGDNFNALFQQADLAMYQVKNQGRNGARLASHAI